MPAGDPHGAAETSTSAPPIHARAQNPEDEPPVRLNLNGWDALVYVARSRRRTINVVILICAPAAVVSGVLYFAAQAHLLAALGISSGGVTAVFGAKAIIKALRGVDGRGGESD